ncbi:hypothetical protein T03_660 [Trichinella britovi]|uniref:Uncharacterized protein n=1 Tax=Trichinella britovi TaxID=45882 RepID=A0A0V0Z1V6_TRIBR|nr:hypothetical protein T03_660 [Trichinella britovi]
MSIILMNLSGFPHLNGSFAESEMVDHFKGQFLSIVSL